MKKMILTGLILAGIISVSMAHEPGDSSLPSGLPLKSAKVMFDNVSSGSKLYIKDEAGQTVYFEKIKADGLYSKNFDLTSLPANEYYFELDSKDAFTVLPFSVGLKDVTVQNEQKREIVKPELLVKGDHVLLSRDVDNEQELSVYIYFRGQELVYDEEIEREGTLLRKYDFSTSMRGEYLFYIKYEDRVFMEYVNMP